MTIVYTALEETENSSEDRELIPWYFRPFNDKVNIFYGTDELFTYDDFEKDIN